MKDDKNTLNKKVLQWIENADSDLEVAKHSFSIKSCIPYKLIAFHAQQCVEKYLKAFLVLKKTNFPYTHNISILLEICSIQADWNKSINFAKELTSYAITARYPGIDDEVTEDEAKEAVKISEKVRETVRTALIQEGLNI